ncbi:hypothetical protein TNCV_4189441 [Trichonephila clavipes]|nr:hypothetical protein TNCV_4189441 [Trichonephila clavipes]
MSNKILVKRKISVTKIFQILIETYGDETLTRAPVFKLHKRFQGGRDSVENDEGAGSPIRAVVTGSGGKRKHIANASFCDTEDPVPKFLLSN